MADQAILREYLLSLGFKIDKAAQSKFIGSVTDIDKRIGSLAKGAIAVAGAATTMVEVFAHQMEKLYYASKRIDSTVGNIQALEFGAKNIGLSGDQMRASLEGMARALRSNPGLTGLLNKLGVQVEGRDMSDVVTDMVTQLKKMPFAVAERYANLFGMDADTLFMLQQGIEEMKKAAELRKQMAADAGFDMEAAAKASKEYANSLREVWERVGLIASRVSFELLPSFQRFNTFLINNLDSLNKWLGNHKTIGEAIASPFVEENSRRVGPPSSIWDWITTHRVNPDKKTRMDSGKVGDLSGESKEDQFLYLKNLEKNYALPDGLLSRAWKKESNNGDPRYMRSEKGAKGHFQFMDPTAKQYGVTDPDNFQQSATGAAAYFADLLKQYEGDVQKAVAAYNWGPGNVSKYGLGSMPAETKDYVNSVAGAQVNQTNNITVTGVTDPDKAAAAIKEEMSIVNADLVRAHTPRVK